MFQTLKFDIIKSVLFIKNELLRIQINFVLTVRAHIFSGIRVRGLAEKSTVSRSANILILSGILGISLRDKSSSTNWLKYDLFLYWESQFGTFTSFCFIKEIFDLSKGSEISDIYYKNKHDFLRSNADFHVLSISVLIKQKYCFILVKKFTFSKCP